jgi:predicted RNase H-like HicB family nuclease
MAEYIAAIFEDQGGFGVVFPDFPGCVSQGETLEGARVMAEEALGLHIKGMLADGEALPRPLGLDLTRAHELCEGASAFIAVRAPGSKAARVTRI